MVAIENKKIILSKGTAITMSIGFFLSVIVFVGFIVQDQTHEREQLMRNEQLIEKIPQIYARKDITENQYKELNRRLERIDAKIDKLLDK